MTIAADRILDLLFLHDAIKLPLSFSGCRYYHDLFKSMFKTLPNITQEIRFPSFNLNGNLLISFHRNQINALPSTNIHFLQNSIILLLKMLLCFLTPVLMNNTTFLPVCG